MFRMGEHGDGWTDAILLRAIMQVELAKNPNWEESFLR